MPFLILYSSGCGFFNSKAVNDISIPALDEAQAQLSIGTRVPHRNPFEAKPPVFVDAAANGTLVLDVSGLQRRSY